MKKAIIAFAILLIIFIACVYILIPSKLYVSAIAEMKAPVNGVYRCVNNGYEWHKWLNEPTDKIQKKIIVTSSFINVVNILIYNGKDSINTTMNLLPLTNDSMAVQWKFLMTTGFNPFAKISRYNEAVQLKKNMDRILSQLKSFVSKYDNIYGLSIHESSINDTILISTKTILTHYPTTNDIYALIDKLKKYAVQSKAQITGYPMYNVTKIEGDTVRLMTAIPINKELKQVDSIWPVRMVPGRFLTGQVTGGNATVKNALNQMQLYFADHNRTAMAIPFTYLITDRRQQPDTSKWITKIYAPVF